MRILPLLIFLWLSSMALTSQAQGLSLPQDRLENSILRHYLHTLNSKFSAETEPLAVVTEGQIPNWEDWTFSPPSDEGYFKRLNFVIENSRDAKTHTVSCRVALLLHFPENSAPQCAYQVSDCIVQGGQQYLRDSAETTSAYSAALCGRIRPQARSN